jgi:predicted NAD/FAD-dependent oxidoreductase
MRIAIIGAGIAGVTLGRALQSHADVTVYEKSRGIGGRMATRRADGFTFDHGAQYFTVRDPRFAKVVEEALAAGVVAEWPCGEAAGVEDAEKRRFIGAPAMNAFPKFLAHDLSVETEAQVSVLRRVGDVWRIEFQNGVSAEADLVISTAPAPQTSALFASDFAETDILKRTVMQGCFTLMLGGDDLPLTSAPVSIRPQDSAVGWIARNSDKSGRDGSPTLVIQSTNDWAEENLERPANEVEAALKKEAAEILGADLSAATFSSLHRWRYAAASIPAGADFLIDEEQKLAACGDWCLGARVECAFKSADRLAARLLQIIQA